MSIAPDNSVSLWLHALQSGDRDVIPRLWDRYFRRMTAIARGKLRNAVRVADEEDVALSAFDSFCQGLDRGRFPDLRNRDELWSLLVVITLRKAINLVHSEAAKKRGGSEVVLSDERIMHDIACRECPPEVVASMNDEFQTLLNRLPDDRFRTLALLKLDGLTNEECAAALGRTRITIQRMLTLIRETWGRQP